MRRLLPLAIAALVLAGCGGKETVTPAPETVEGEIQQPTVAEGDPAAGEEVFASAGCGGCHAFEAAGTSGTTGPDLDESLEGKDAEYIRESIVNPDAEIAEGFSPGVMPSYSGQLEDQQIADLVAFLAPEG